MYSTEERFKHKQKLNDTTDMQVNTMTIQVLIATCCKMILRETIRRF